MNNGFSLIELLFVMIIIGILTSFAYPSYKNYIVHARRSDGQTALLDLANRMEQYYYENNTYQTATIATGNVTDVLASNLSTGGWYILSIVKAAPTNYLLQAAPLGMQAKNDTRCQTLTLDNIGTKGINQGPEGIPNGTINNCW